MKQANHGDNMFGQISDMTLYASREEVEKLYKDITKMCEPYTKRNDQKENQEVFQLFTTLSQHVDEPTESPKSKVPPHQPGDQGSDPKDDAKEK
ncbi:hypothetical protein N6H13_04120 [Paenibacillus sp. CC-CFT742]|nr:hypothetical protein [Paenibacillus sp. CC-CFT742]WJH29937.1 hypothetical protein N6H13_04120 [Paenibacillus sp. CC-CFT742]